MPSIFQMLHTTITSVISRYRLGAPLLSMAGRSRYAAKSVRYAAAAF